MTQPTGPFYDRPKYLNIFLTGMPKLYLPHTPREYLDYTLTLPKKRRPPEVIAIYLHGFASHQHGEKARYLKEKFLGLGAAYLSFDHRGHGSSSGTMEALTTTRNLEDLDAVLHAKTQGFRRRLLVGSSMGGQTAAWYAAAYPDRVSANLLIAPGFGFAQSCLRLLGAKERKQLKEKGKTVLVNEWIEVAISRELVKDSRKYPLGKLAAQARTPTLILHGLEDTTAPFQDSVAFARKSQAVPTELVLIAGGDHRLTDRLEVLFSYMQAFCKRLGLLK